MIWLTTFDFVTSST